MKDRFLDVIKWGLILIISGAVFYVVYPKYYFYSSAPGLWTRGNMMTGKVERSYATGEWQEIGIKPKAVANKITIEKLKAAGFSDEEIQAHILKEGGFSDKDCSKVFDKAEKELKEKDRYVFDGIPKESKP